MSSINLTNLPSLVVNGNLLTASTQGSTTEGMSQVVMSQSMSTPAEQTPTEAQQLLQGFWQKQLEEVRGLDMNDFKVQDLPLARIKKIMKMDEDVKMISAEAPLLFAKAAQMFITELSLRAWIHTEENKRRTLQRNDIATAITKFDQFDFLIDIVPREDLKQTTRRATDETRGSGENVQYFYTVPQQQVAQQNSTPVINQSSAQTGQIVITQPSNQIVQLGGQIVGSDTNQQVLQIGQQQQQQQQQQQPQQQQQQNTVSLNHNLIQQLIAHSGTNPGDIQSIQISPDGQIQLIKVPGSETSQEQV
uniref:nuclear transcription factor Y subunit gamma isoform X2 n=1 Tax=Ciona intestinalis TaxID=7719 RepID=UPI000EF47097|nr:nuclear transcription factor Y subunit gamma isoform X2 [Ciona intestinalis]|eukprot:XP_026691083.1 nuclear transcription factor Y subunit gamma isoform X2 [Ciona intestinalis]